MVTGQGSATEMGTVEVPVAVQATSVTRVVPRPSSSPHLG